MLERVNQNARGSELWKLSLKSWMSMLFLEIFMMSALTIHTTGSLILLSAHLITKEPADILDKCAAKITFQWLKLALLDTVVMYQQE